MTPHRHLTAHPHAVYNSLTKLQPVKNGGRKRGTRQNLSALSCVTRITLLRHVLPFGAEGVGRLLRGDTSLKNKHRKRRRADPGRGMRWARVAFVALFIFAVRYRFVGDVRKRFRSLGENVLFHVGTAFCKSETHISPGFLSNSATIKNNWDFLLNGTVWCWNWLERHRN